MKHMYHNTPIEDRFAQKLREASESYEPVFNEGDWMAMQSKLGQHNKTKNLWLWMGGAAVSILALLFAGNYVFNHHNPQNTQVASSNKLPTNTTNANSNQIKTLDYQQSNSAGSLGMKPSLNHQDEAITTIALPVAQMQENNTAKYSTGASESAVTRLLVPSSKNHVTAMDRDDLHTITTPLKRLGINNTVLEHEVMYPQLLSSLAEPVFELPNISSPHINLEEQNETTLVFSKWRVGAVLKGMFNFYNSNNKLHTNYTNGLGVLVDRDLGKRFSLSTGAMYLQKNVLFKEPSSAQVVNSVFSKSIEDYTIEQKKETRISWKMIDTPIHLRYNAVSTPKNRWFVSAGISNYFILSEKSESNFKVTKQDDFDARFARVEEVKRQEEKKVTTFEPLATLNVSVGLETAIGRHFTLQVEPYWNLPMRSLGSEGVFVQSGGLQTRINFNK